MRINNNLMALNAHRYMSQANQKQSKSLEKLSSGLAINSAADNAAGLAISEKMRAQINGLDQAQANAQDGISMIQTAEGALQETENILQRMRELAVQSANDTNTSEDRSEIQKEIDQLASEITRISESTEFNTKKLLDGSLTGKLHIGANEGQDLSVAINAMDAQTLKVGTETAAQATYDVSVTITAGAAGAAGDGTGGNAVDFAVGTYSVVEIADYEGTTLVDGNVQGGSASAVTHVMVGEDGNAVGSSVGGSAFNAIGDVTVGKTGTTSTDGTRASLTLAAGTTEVAVTTTIAATATIETEVADGQSIAAGDYTVVNDGGLQLQDSDGNAVAYSADGAAWTTEAAGAGDAVFTTATLTAGATITVGESDIKGIDVSTQEASSTAITTLNTAINAVSAERANLGSIQNRLDHTINNLSTTAENMTASESRIRDVDMAKEMMEYTKLGILQQASQAMLAQANQAPQGVLQLLQ